MLNVKTLNGNLTRYNRRIGDERLRLTLPHELPPQVKREIARSGQAILSVQGEDGAWKTLHSRVHPERDHIPIAAAGNKKQGEYTVVLGAGLGYHLLNALRSDAAGTIVVVERNPAVIAALLSEEHASELVSNPGFIIVSDPDPEAVLKRLDIVRLACGVGSGAVVEHKASVRAFPAFYGQVAGRLNSGGANGLNERLRYGKFAGESMNILILHTKYYLLVEIIQALRQLGHRPTTVMLQQDLEQEASQEVFENLLQTILETRPDFVLTVNHLGFDRQGILTRLFNEIEMPFASWFIDSPLFILEEFQKQHSDYLALFLWDADYLQDVRRMGFQNAFFLPLATDPAVFKPVSPHANPLGHLACDVGFVGSSWTNSLTQCLNKLKNPSQTLPALLQAARLFMHSPERRIENVPLGPPADWTERYHEAMCNERQAFEPAITWAATQQYRINCLNQLQEFNPTICGDPGWSRLMNGNSVLRPELNYYDELPFFYNVCTVNFNTTSLQMKSGFNQRVFDVPASGSFLLTDYREQLQEVFDLHDEVVCYRQPEEIPELTAFYLRNHNAREQVVRRARTRILSEHTYVRRLSVLTETMQRLYG